MSKYFMDCEFLEGIQTNKFLWFKSQSIPTIDLISIGIVCEDNRQYYAISKDFNLKEAWNRYDLVINKQFPLGPEYRKNYWIRENVLASIWKELKTKHDIEYIMNYPIPSINYSDNTASGREFLNKEFSYKSIEFLIKKYGKTNKEIAEEIKEFVYKNENIIYNHENCKLENVGSVKSKIEFYGFYADYDWVVFCWLFGKMINLPTGFPMYCKDLKQIIEDKIDKSWNDVKDSTWGHEGISDIKKMKDYPKQTNEHNALSDAMWNKELYNFLINIK